MTQPVAGWKSFEEPAEQPASSQLVQRQSTGGDIWGSLPVRAGAEAGGGPAGGSKQQAGMPREAGEAHSKTLLKTPLKNPKRLAGGTYFFEVSKTCGPCDQNYVEARHLVLHAVCCKD